MRRVLGVTLVFLAALVLAGSAAASDVILKDGTVIHAASYKVQGSYVLVRLENGSQVAYDLGDVNLEAMEAAKAAAAPPAPAKAQAAPQANAFSGAMAATRGKPALKITDQDVGHVDRGTSPTGAAKEAKKPLADHQEGGQVIVQGVMVNPGKEPGTWLATGKVINRKNRPVMDVRVLVQAIGPDSKVLGEAELPVAGTLDPGKSGKFSHLFHAHDRPLLRVRVFWMQREKTAPAPRRGAGGQAASPPAQPASVRSASSRVSGNTSTRPVGGGRPPSLQWGGAPVYKRAGSGPAPTPPPY